MDKPILFYSKYCSYSVDLLNTLSKNELESFIFLLNIDPDVHSKKRPELFYKIQSHFKFKLNAVPALLVNNSELLYGNDTIISWVTNKYSQRQNSTRVQQKNNNTNAQKSILKVCEPSSFNPNELSCAPLSTSNDVFQSHTFYNQPLEKINTPAIDSFSKQELNYSKLEQDREMNSGAIPPKQVRFAENTVKNDISKTYEQLLQERQIVETPPPKNIDFTTGTYS